MTGFTWKPCTLAGTHDLQARQLGGEHGAAVIAPPHPLYGGTLDNPVVLAIADGLRRAGTGALAFNWRGVEGSQGTATDDLEAAVDDYLAAARTLEGTAPIYAAGYSFGAGTALLAASSEPRFAGVILLAPPVGMISAAALTAVRAPLLIVVGDDDDYAPLPQLRAALVARPDAALEVIAGADHFFHFGGIQAIAARVAAEIERWQRPFAVPSRT